MKQLSTQTFDVMQAHDAPPSEGQRYVIEDELGYLFNFVAKLFTRKLAACLAEHGIGMGQWPVLLFLWSNDGRTQTELSRHVLIDDATMVRTIDRMERDGLVERVRNPQDRRQHNIFLTEQGRTLRDELIPCALTTNASMLEGFSDDERDQLRDMLRRIIIGKEPQALSGTTMGTTESSRKA